MNYLTKLIELVSQHPVTEEAHTNNQTVPPNTVATLATHNWDLVGVPTLQENVFSRKRVKIGKGGMGTVFKVFHEVDQREYAMKCIPLKAETRGTGEKEVWMMSKKNHHEHLVKFIGWINNSQKTLPDGPEICIVMEYCDASLFSIIKKRVSRFSTEQMEHVLKCVNSALRYLHEEDYVHRDIKSANILIKWENYQSGNFSAKLADFGSMQKKKMKVEDLGHGHTGLLNYLGVENLLIIRICTPWGSFYGKWIMY